MGYLYTYKGWLCHGKQGVNRSHCGLHKELVYVSTVIGVLKVAFRKVPHNWQRLPRIILLRETYRRKRTIARCMRMGKESVPTCNPGKASSL